jgi:hypothetical protein
MVSGKFGCGLAARELMVKALGVPDGPGFASSIYIASPDKDKLIPAMREGAEAAGKIWSPGCASSPNQNGGGSWSMARWLRCRSAWCRRAVCWARLFLRVGMVRPRAGEPVVALGVTVPAGSGVVVSHRGKCILLPGGRV